MSDENNEKKNNENRRFLGKVKNNEGQYGRYQKILIDNPSPTKKDGSEDPYYKGSLIWIDNVTGKKYLVKQISLRGVSQTLSQKGFVSSISIDLDNAYEVQDLG